MVIYKYELDIKNNQKIEMPEVHEILCVKSQRGRICLWALVDPTSMPVAKDFCVFGTGHTVSKKLDRKYIGTCMTHNDQCVWHVFEVI